ncbi:AAA family ATPase [Planotetraspora sp. A-T 1434]|uniref:AAA family ATPase n=1 Tax=Planotetraspora sp. A-T 1434 TaxID=2979219 RepID=UPI0021BDF509|nr:AAA family ATPase [Planotetraspora sp. A-T 1434]MCT9929354.1 AAA family ATPase [Planotetraspora sp. A-T 1434]
MRLHRMRLVAFGSFPGTEEVDFDALGEAGLFLIHGPTGAGKTTVLDAVCYGLYGRVPGQRDSVRSLRCDHAPPGRGPAVVLEVTIRERRFRITRSPAWTRPRRKGTGMVEEKAKVLVEEFTGEWTARTTRSDEAGHLIGELMGMNADQFWQVAMLPQGEFARFLRADGDDRRKLLERLFSVKLFTEVEKWLAERRTVTGRERQELRQRVDSVVDRMRGAAGDELPVPDDEPEAVLTLAGAALDRAAEACTAGQAALRSARSRLKEGQELAERQARHATALARRDEIDQAAEERSDLEAILDEAARADRVLPLIRQVEQRAEAAAKARRLAADAVSRALPVHEGQEGQEGQAGERPDEGPRDAEWRWEERLAELERRRRDEIAQVRQLLPEESRLNDVRAELHAARRALSGLAEQETRLAGRLAVLPGERQEAESLLVDARVAAASIPGLAAARDLAVRLREVTREAERAERAEAEPARREAEALAARDELPRLLDAARARLKVLLAEAARVPALEAACQIARDRLDAAVLRDALAGELESAERDRRAAIDRAQDARDRLQEVRRARIDGMAAELAASLVEGEPCVVCGSADHPAPAQASGAGFTERDEQAAHDHFEAARQIREEAEARVAGLSSRLGDVTARAGGLPAAQARAALSEAEAELARLREVAAGEPGAAAEVARLAADLDAARDEAEEAGRLVAESRARLAGLLAERDRLAGDAADLADAERSLRRAEQTAAREPGLVQAAARLTAELEELTGRARQIEIEAARTRARRERLAADEERLAALVDGARGADPSLAARLDRLLDEAELMRDAAEATRTAATADREHEEALERAADAAAEAGFPGPGRAGLDRAGAAVRSAADREAMAGRLRFLDTERATADRLLADPELAAAAAEPAPDLAGLQLDHDRAEREHATRTSARDRARDRLDQLTGLAAELDAAVRRYRPAEERHRLARRLAELTGGTSTDNEWHMRLSSFVLGERLRQVVEAANERLDHMSAGRYRLQHDMRKAAGDRARSGGGLGLRVLDGWTGVDRDPASLSGGESFITSLALALGLADVVTTEAGGAEIGSLFVDEGFSTLDDETLDDVLDILDGLREGGRAVGIVSHVAELRVRIPAQLKVVKGRSGSTLL